MTNDRVQAPRDEGAGYRIPRRDPAHAHPQWFELGTDEDYNDPDDAFVDPLPTERHRRVPDDLPRWS
jgi:hypothetical protein